jgi:23S rRNA (cytidine1920-2'-O)/16S rRNA (cytidine1409-2'-O)-methyltransferase
VMRGAIAGRKSGNVEYPLHLLRGAESTLDEARILEVVGRG